MQKEINIFYFLLYVYSFPIYLRVMETSWNKLGTFVYFTWNKNVKLHFVKGSSKNDVSGRRGRGVNDFVTTVLRGWGGLQNCPKLFDVIYGRPLNVIWIEHRYIHFIRMFLIHNLARWLEPLIFHLAVVLCPHFSPHKLKRWMK